MLKKLANTAAVIRLAAKANLAIAVVMLASVTLITVTRPAAAMDIQKIKSPGGIEAWLVEEHSVPLFALRYAFFGGSSQDLPGKEGTGNFITGMMDEGAGDLKSAEYQEAMEDIAMRMSYEDSKDSVYGTVQALTADRDRAMELLKLSLQKPRFDPDAVERIRQQLLANLAYAEKDPDKVAGREWNKMAFPGHPYGTPDEGTLQTISKITRDDLIDYHKRVFAKSNLKVVAVGDIDAATFGKLLDDVFGGLPDKDGLTPVTHAEPASGQQKVFEMNVPQSIAIFGLGAMDRKDPDFIPAFVVNHIIGSGGFSSKLMEEVREKRGLAYSVYTYLQPFKDASILIGSVATKNESMAESLSIIRAELKKIADQGPTEKDLREAKDYLIGSYALRFDTNSKIAAQLLGLQQEGFDTDYVENRNKMIEAVTIEDAKRVAKRLFDIDKLIVAIVGKPVGVDKGTVSAGGAPAVRSAPAKEPAAKAANPG